MIIYNKRCIHCKDNYTHQIGNGIYHDILDDENYCPKCKEAILKTLKTIPKKYESITVEQNEVTLDMVLEWEKLNDRERANSLKKSFYGAIKRTSEYGYEKERIGIVNGRDKYKDYQYLYSYFLSEKENGKVKIFAQKDILTGEITYCNEFSNYSQVDIYDIK